MLVSCGSPATPLPPEKPIELPALVDLAPAAGLDSLVEARPRELLAHPELLPLVYEVVPQTQLETFARRHGGVDPLKLEDLVVASYGASTLALAEGDFDPARIEQAFSDRTTRVTGRFIDSRGGPLSTVVRLEGDAADGHLALVLFGRRAVGVETHAVPGRAGPLRASELFALHKLARARPALRSAPLEAAAQALGDAPVRIFYPGPFEGESAKGLAGLLQAATAVAIAIRPHFSGSDGDRSAPNDPHGRAALDVTIDLLGAWNDDASSAGQRFAAAAERIAESDLGRLCGLNVPIRGPILKTSPTVLSLFAVIDAERLASGAHSATGSQIDEIMK
ncbi:MAG TPA: hypothetical protein VGH28_06350 [Polyangiaceae bacterium]